MEVKVTIGFTPEAQKALTAIAHAFTGGTGQVQSPTDTPKVDTPKKEVKATKPAKTEDTPPPTAEAKTEGATPEKVTIIQLRSAGTEAMKVNKTAVVEVLTSLVPEGEKPQLTNVSEEKRSEALAAFNKIISEA